MKRTLPTGSVSVQLGAGLSYARHRTSCLARHSSERVGITGLTLVLACPVGILFPIYGTD